MAGRKCSMIKDINDGTDMWRIIVRVVRRWNSFQKDSPSDLHAICFLLVDEEGDKIQASILNRYLFNQYESIPIEGRSYFIANVEVIPNGKDYKAAKHKFKLLFNSSTYVREEPSAVPLSVFSFFPIRDILKQTIEHHTMYLFDVIAFVLNIGPLEEFRSGTEVKNKMRLTLSDERENAIQMVLYDECALNFCMNDFNVMQKPIVLVVQLARIGFDESGTPEVCSSYHATKITLNAKFLEVQNFLASAQNFPSPTISTLSQPLVSQRSNSACESILKNTPTIKVSDIPHQEVEKYFTVVCEFKKFETRYGWIYEGCSRCGTKPKIENGSASCGSNYCKGKACSIQSKLRLNYLIADDSGTASVVLFDKHATDLLKKCADDLKANIPQEAMCYEFPNELDSLIGKRMILKMKLNKYNKDHPNSSVSVANYAECSDLIHQFDDAASQPGETIGLVNDEEEEIILVRNGTTQEKCAIETNVSVGLADSFPTIDLDNEPNSEVMRGVLAKGKRKVVSKKPPGQSSKSTGYVPVSPAKSPSKPLKSIKQEKK